MNNIRVIVADDSAFTRALLRDFLESDREISVVAEAKNGQEAVDLVRQHRPHLVTMDLEMPVMGGMEAIELIMASCAVPILVVSAVADAGKAYDAVARGALEVIDKPEASSGSRAELVAKVKMLAGVKVISHIRGPGHAAAMLPRPLPPAASTQPVMAGSPTRLFAIASSTGGPQVLAALLPRLPACFPCPIVVAQHIAEGFASGLADWLGGLSRVRVRMAEAGGVPEPGVVHISPSEAHLVITPAGRFALMPRALKDIYRPSCDALLGSVAEAYGRRAVGIILTGMGSDGAAGMGRIRAGGGITLGQDDASSLIYGMNRVAIERGTVQQVLAADDIPARMIALAGLNLEGAPFVRQDPA